VPARQHSRRNSLPTYAARAAEGQLPASGKRIPNTYTKRRSLAQWYGNIQHHWNNIPFQNLSVDTRGCTHHVTIQIYLDPLSPDMVSVVIFLYAQGDLGPYRQS
jgi:hypothetical protein